MVHEFCVGHYNFTMLLVRQILVIALVPASGAVSLSACGQQGPLYLPTEAAAAKRATLPQTLLRRNLESMSKSDATSISSPLNPPAPAASATSQ
jgi:predicted small lipoprotein YifL